MERIKKVLKSSSRMLGIEISKVRKPPISPLVHHKIDLLLDVGANTGQYALMAREAGYKNKIVSFEPLSSAHAILKNTAEADSLWIVHERCAIGPSVGEIQINISQNSYSSSLLPMLSTHLSAAPDSVYIGQETAKLLTLDSVFSDYRQSVERVFLKIDTQGYEKEVLDGGRECVKHISAIQLELSLVPLYESQQLYEYFFDYLRDAGFTLWSLVPGIWDLTTGQLLQFDGIFVRRW